MNLKAKSLKVYWEKFEPILSIRAPMDDYHLDNNLVNLPLYAIEEINPVG